MFNTRSDLAELVRRLGESAPRGTELVLVDDACPEGSGAAAASLRDYLPMGLTGRVVGLSRSVGQYAAVLIGLAHATGRLIAVMDADLQDAPEDLTTLLDCLNRANTSDVVAAGRRGDYESANRLRTAALYRRCIYVLSRGAIPVDAGMFCVMTREARARILAVGDPTAPLIPAAAKARLRIITVPLHRHARADGLSSASSKIRLRSALNGLVTVSPAHRVLRRRRSAKWRPPAVTIVELSPATRT